MVSVVTKKTKTCECSNCLATLEYYEIEVGEATHRYYDGSAERYKFITCPECNKRVEVD